MKQILIKAVGFLFTVTAIAIIAIIIKIDKSEEEDLNTELVG